MKWSWGYIWYLLGIIWMVSWTIYYFKEGFKGEESIENTL